MEQEQEQVTDWVPRKIQHFCLYLPVTFITPYSIHQSPCVGKTNI